MSFWLLRTFCPDHLYEEISGDLVQRFEKDSKKLGVAKAKRRLIWNALRFFRPGIILRSKFSNNSDPIGMHRHFFKIFARTSVRNGAYTIINISGLAVGLTAAIFIFLWSINELSFDEFHADKDQIYKVLSHHTYPDNVATFDNTSGRLGPALKDLPEVVETARQTDQGGKMLFTTADKSIYETGAYADPSIFRIFTIPITQGHSENILPDNRSIAISEQLARKYFSDDSALGKTFRLNNELDVKVTAVYQDFPRNSTLQFHFILPYELFAKRDQYNEEWGAWTGGVTYVKVHPGADITALDKKINEQFTKPKIWPRWDTNVELFLFSINDWRLRDQFVMGKQSGGAIFYVQIFGAAGLFMLLIACFNFMNLTTARSITRLKEIGVRKFIGAGRASLAVQFLGEALFTTIFSLVLSLLMVVLLLPFFNDFTGKQLVINYGDPILWLGLAAITIFTGLVAGAYPAIVFSSLQAIHILKGKLSGFTGTNVRKLLVVFQFGLSVVLIVCAVVTHQQIEYARSKNLGFDRNNVFYLSMNDALRKNFTEFKQRALQSPSVRFVSRSDYNPMDVEGGLVLADDAWPGKTKADNIPFTWLQCDHDFLAALGFKFLEGRNFSPEFKSDSVNYIITKESARMMRLKDPVGQFLNGPSKGHIVGVIDDFHSAGLQRPIRPIIIGFNPGVARRLFISYESGKTTEAIAHVQKVYKEISPDFPMELDFIDKPFESQYRDEILIGKLSNCFMAIAVFISSLGLFGLSSFAAARRSKELSLRKVLGASVLQVVVLLCRDFAVLIGAALLVGLPVAWLVMDKFLQTFAFHIELGLSVFVITIVSMIVIALMTVSFQSLKAALSNPVNALKNE